MRNSWRRARDSCAPDWISARVVANRPQGKRGAVLRSAVTQRADLPLAGGFHVRHLEAARLPASIGDVTLQPRHLSDRAVIDERHWRARRRDERWPQPSAPSSSMATESFCAGSIWSVSVMNRGGLLASILIGERFLDSRLSRRRSHRSGPGEPARRTARPRLHSADSR